MHISEMSCNRRPWLFTELPTVLASTPTSLGGHILVEAHPIDNSGFRSKRNYGSNGLIISILTIVFFQKTFDTTYLDQKKWIIKNHPFLLVRRNIADDNQTLYILL